MSENINEFSIPKINVEVNSPNNELIPTNTSEKTKQENINCITNLFYTIDKEAESKIEEQSTKKVDEYLPEEIFIKKEIKL